jgi:hypothetical protein
MNTNVNGGSATIYQFPEGGRASMNGQSGRVAAASFGSQFVGEATYGSWYHDEAIRESQQPKMVQPKKIQTKPVIVPLTFPRQ